MRRSLIILVTGIAVIGLLGACGGPAAPTESQFTEVPRVSLEEAKAALDAEAAVFLDVRAQASFEAQHIPGALNIPLPELEARLGELDKAEWIITYCT